MNNVDVSARSFCLRAKAYLKAESAPEQGHGVPLLGEHSPVLRRLGNRLLSAYLVDEGDHFAYVQGRHLLAAGMSADALHSRAVANLAAFAEQHIEVHEYGRIFTSVGSEFSASVLLCDVFWDVWYANLVPGGVVASIPARNVLAFGDVAQPQTLVELCELYEQGRPWLDHPLSATLFRRIGQHWIPLQEADGLGMSKQ